MELRGETHPTATVTQRAVMTMRERVLVALGNQCEWCGAPGPLEIDHIAGGGNQHRAQIGIKLHVWLWREYVRTGAYPHGFRLLCKAHHDVRSGRRAMPAREGATSLQITFPDEVVDALTKRATLPEYKNSKSAVVVQAVTEWLQDTPNETLILALHQRLDALTTALEDMRTAVSTHTPHILSLEQALQRQRQELLNAYDRVRSRVPTQRHWLARLWHG
jgi:hypothetical protein